MQLRQGLSRLESPRSENVKDIVSIGLIAAIPQELAHLRNAMSGVDSVHVAHALFDTGLLNGRDVVLAETGVAKSTRHSSRPRWLRSARRSGLIGR